MNPLPSDTTPRPPVSQEPVVKPLPVKPPVTARLPFVPPTLTKQGSVVAFTGFGGSDIEPTDP